MRFHQKNLRWFFPRAVPLIEGVLHRAIDDLGIDPHGRGQCVNVMTGPRGGLTVYRDAMVTPQEGSNRLRVYLMKEDVSKPENLNTRFGNISARFDFPLTLFTPDVSEAEKAYSMYHIRFALPEDSPLGNCVTDPLFRGYIGITKRHPFIRFGEHFKTMASGNGYLLHSTWRSVASKGVEFHPVLQVSGLAGTLKEIYAAEEKFVAEYTLAPLGLNAIPGGEAGIRMLHQLALLSGKKLPGLAEREAAIARMYQERKSPLAHLRNRHLREYMKGKFTWVSECWVNQKELACA